MNLLKPVCFQESYTTHNTVQLTFQAIFSMHITTLLFNMPSCTTTEMYANSR